MPHAIDATMRKDWSLIVHGRFLLLMSCSLVCYGLYVNYVYAPLDVSPYQVYVYGPQAEWSQNIMQLESADDVLRALDNDTAAIGLVIKEDITQVYLHSSGSDKTDSFRQAYALALLHTDETIGEVRILTDRSGTQKRRLEMMTVLIFFEITAIGFLGSAGLFFKEKQMGAIRVLGVLPRSHWGFLVSKVLLFLALDLVFVAVLGLTTIGVNHTLSVFPALLPQVVVLSLSMVLTGFSLALLFKDFRQFGFAYVFLLVFLTSPVFLVANTALHWEWVRFYPVYHLFVNLKQAFFGLSSPGSLYYAASAAWLIVLLGASHKLLLREISRG